MLFCGFFSTGTAAEVFLGMGAGEVSSLDGTYETEFELWGGSDGTNVKAIKFNVNDTPFHIEIVSESSDGNQAAGLLTPCEDGVCQCTLEGDEETGRAEGFCSNSRHPEYGEMGIKFQIVGGESPPQSSGQENAAQVAKPWVAGQFTLMASAPGQVIAQGETRDATFEILGDGEQARLIRIDAGGDQFEINVDVNNTGSSEGTGQFSPCEGGNCPCNMSEIDGGIRGSCTNPARPEHGEMQFSVWLNGQPAARASQPTAPPSRPVQPPPIQQKQASTGSDAKFLNDWAAEARASTASTIDIFEITRIASRCPAGCEDVFPDTYLGFFMTMPRHTKGDMSFESLVSRVTSVFSSMYCAKTEAVNRKIIARFIIDDMRGTRSANTLVQPSDCASSSYNRPVQAPPVPRQQAVVAVPVAVRMYSWNEALAQHPNIGKVYTTPIWLDVTMSDGTAYTRIEYEEKYPNNIVFDDISGDPNNLIEVYRNNKFNQRRWVRPTGRGMAGIATLKVSFRNTPNVAASFRVTVDTRLAKTSDQPQFTAGQQTASQVPPAAKKPVVPIYAKLTLRSTLIINEQSYYANTYKGEGEAFTPIYLQVTFSDGTKSGLDYHIQFPDNVVFDDWSDDKYNLIDVVHRNNDPSQPLANLTSRGGGMGRATLKVSFRDAPNVIAMTPVAIIGTHASTATPPVARPTPAQPEPTLLGTGRGEISGADAEFSVFALGGKATQIKIDTDQNAHYFFQIDKNSLGQDELAGSLSPCRGGAWACTVFEVCTDYFIGHCEPNNEVSFSFRLK